MAASSTTPAMPDTEEFNKKFLGIIRRHPEIYDSSLPEYSNRKKRENAWDEVARATETTNKQCKKRWRSIRDSFVRDLGNAEKTPYYLHEHLQFLVPYIKSKKQSSNLQNLPNVDSTEVSDDDDIIEVKTEAEDQGQNTLHAEPANDGGVSKDLPVVGELQRNLERKQKCSVEDVAASYSASRANDMNDNDGMLLFFKSLLPDINKFSDRQKRQFQVKIIGIVDEFAENEDK